MTEYKWTRSEKTMTYLIGLVAIIAIIFVGLYAKRLDDIRIWSGKDYRNMKNMMSECGNNCELTVKAKPRHETKIPPKCTNNSRSKK